MRGLIIAATILTIGVTAPASGPNCSVLGAQTGTCPTVSANLTPDAATLEGTTTSTGSSGSTTNGSTTPNPDPFASCDDPASTTCLRPIPATVTAPVTLADIAAFRPVPPVDHMQPNGWTIAGLDTNFYATGGTHIRDGQLLGQPASVRFTPVSWHWAYGDGAHATRSQPGSTWSAQSIPEFDPTPTSHIYTAYGTYSIDLDVTYTAEYRYGGGPWTPIAGTLNLPANRLQITVGNAKTVLVNHNCTIHPSGPGC
ncbi:MAG: hypothetical protein KF761_04225 [Salinibacterium sp.]|nr:hypothetical protein [Salinibacterium sp.]